MSKVNKILEMLDSITESDVSDELHHKLMDHGYIHDKSHTVAGHKEHIYKNHKNGSTITVSSKTNTLYYNHPNGGTSNGHYSHRQMFKKLGDA